MLLSITKKVLMITLYLVLGYQAQASYLTTSVVERMPASEREVTSEKNICMIHAGDIGKLKYKGATYEQAFKMVTNECFQKRTQLFVQSRQMQPDQDRQIDFVESCVNSVKCI